MGADELPAPASARKPATRQRFTLRRSVQGEEVDPTVLRALQRREWQRQGVALRLGVFSVVVSFFASSLQQMITCMEWVIEKLVGRVAPEEVPDVVEECRRMRSPAAQQRRAERLVDEGRAEEAVRIYVALLEEDPDNTALLDLTAELLADLGFDEYAMHLLLKSVALRPEHNPRKYATLSRLQHGEAALASLETALQLLTLHEVQYTNELGAASEPVRQTRGEMAQVFVALSQVYLQDLTLQPGWKDKWKDSACLKLVQQALEYDAECEGAFRVLAEVESLQRGIAVMPNNIDVEQDSVSTPVLKTPRVPSRRSKTRARSAAKDVLEEPRTPAQTLARVMSPLTATTAAFSPCATSPAAATPDGFVPMQLQFTPELVPPSCTPKRGKSGSGNPTRLALAHSSPSPAQPADEPLLPMTLEAIFSPAASHSPALRSAPAAATPATPDPSDDPTPALDEAPDPTSLDFFSSPFRSLPTSPPEQPTRGGPISSLTTETRVIAVEENTAGSHRPFAEPFPEPLDEHRQPAAVPMFDFGGWFATSAVAPIYSDSTDAAAEGPASTEAGRVAQVEAAPTEQEPMVAEGAAAERGRGGAVTEVELNSCGEEGEDAGDVEDAETVFVRIAEGYQWSVPSTAAHGRPPGTDIEHDDAHGGFAHVPDDTLTEEMDEQVMAAAAVARRAAEAAREAAEKEAAEVAPRAAKQAAEVAIAEPPDEASVEALATHIETTGEAADQQAPETKVAPEVLIAAEASASGHARVSVGVSRRSSKGGKKKKKGSTKAGR